MNVACFGVSGVQSRGLLNIAFWIGIGTREIDGDRISEY
jgi:hypothetical protein